MAPIFEVNPFLNQHSQSNAQDQILVEWESGQSATVHVLVVQAMIVLLTYGQPRGKEMN